MNNRNNKLVYLLIFIVIFSYFLWLNAGASFSDPDSFYHAKIVEMIKEDGLVKDFGWLPFTTLGNIYIDHHLLYHLILVPFFYLGDPLVVLKIATAFLAALVFVVFGWFLGKEKVKYGWVYVFLLLSAHQFVFRINLAKIPAISVIWLLIFLYFLFRQNKKWSWGIFITSFFYVWLYGGWPILLGIGLVYWLVDAAVRFAGSYQLFLKNQENKKSRKQIFYKYCKLQFINYKLLLNIITGIIAGLVINPYFSKNLLFYWQQTVLIGLKNYKDIIGVGGEWYSFNLVNLIGYESLVFIVILLALIVFVKDIGHQSHKSWTLFIVSLVFFVLTLKSRRNVEYFIPFAILFSAMVIDGYLRRGGIDLNKIRKVMGKNVIWTGLAVVLVVLQIIIIFGFHYVSLKNELNNGYSWGRLEQMSEWLRENSQSGEIIFHDDWSDWPVLFYYNNHNRYIIGLDPTFMYFKDGDKYWLWHDLSTGVIENNVCADIKEGFGASYVFVRKENETMRDNVDKDKGCKNVYQDSDGSIYQII